MAAHENLSPDQFPMARYRDKMSRLRELKDNQPCQDCGVP